MSSAKAGVILFRPQWVDSKVPGTLAPWVASSWKALRVYPPILFPFGDILDTYALFMSGNDRRKFIHMHMFPHNNWTLQGLSEKKIAEIMTSQICVGYYVSSSHEICTWYQYHTVRHAAMQHETFRVP